MPESLKLNNSKLNKNLINDIKIIEEEKEKNKITY